MRLPLYYSISCFDGSLELAVPGEFLARIRFNKSGKLETLVVTNPKIIEEMMVVLIENSESLRAGIDSGMIYQGPFSNHHLRQINKLRNLGNEEKLNKKIYGYCAARASIILAENQEILKECNDYHLGPLEERNGN